MKMLYILNVANRVNNFCMSSLIAAKDVNIEFHIAGNWGYKSNEELVADEEKYGIHIYQIDFERNPLSLQNYKAYRQLKELLDREKYDVIHCNTPIGGVVGRLVGKKYKVKNIIYQAHGFHFYKGSQKLNWMLYYPIEKWLARYTDVLVTINQEDYELAKSKLKLRRGGKAVYVPGVGIDISQYNTEANSYNEKRSEFGLGDDDIALISMGDLVERKNYSAAIRAIAKAKNDKLHYFICGKGPEEDKLKGLTESLGVTGQIHFLGFRSDIRELLAASDIFLFTTKQEGLPRSMMEAMAAGLPVVCSKIRGNTDLIQDGQGGFLRKPDDVDGFVNAINELSQNDELRRRMASINLENIKRFDIVNATKEMKLIYEEILNEKNENQLHYTCV